MLSVVQGPIQNFGFWPVKTNESYIVLRWYFARGVARLGLMMKLWWFHARFVPARLTHRLLSEATCLSS